MNNKQAEYINKYNKDNYKMYQFRVRKDDEKLIKFLDSKTNRNSYLISLLQKEAENAVSLEIYTLDKIKELITPVLEKWGIKEVFLFGSYARGEATPESDVDIYCEKGKVQTLFLLSNFEEELKEALQKEVDIVFTTSTMSPYFKEEMEKDLIKL